MSLADAVVPGQGRRMDTALLVRTARRRAGLPQPEFAALAGVSRRTLQAVEAGHGNPSVQTLTQLLRAGGLTLSVAEQPPEADRELESYLVLSLSVRLYLALGGDGTTADRRPGPWRDLGTVATRGRVDLDPVAAVGVWLPGVRAPLPLRVALDERPVPGRRRLRPDVRAVPHLAVRTAPAPVRSGAVPVAVATGGRVHVPPPLLLAAHPEVGEHAPRLRAAADLLHAQALRTAGGLRTPAHRDPDEVADAERLYARGDVLYGQGPYRLDGRGWRLGGPATLAQWLRERGR